MLMECRCRWLQCALVDREGDQLAFQSLLLLPQQRVLSLEVDVRLEFAGERESALERRVVRPQVCVPVTISCNECDNTVFVCLRQLIAQPNIQTACQVYLYSSFL